MQSFSLHYDLQGQLRCVRKIGDSINVCQFFEDSFPVLHRQKKNESSSRTSTMGFNFNIRLTAVHTSYGVLRGTITGCVFIILGLDHLCHFATKLHTPSSQFTKCLPVIITCHSFKLTRFKSERQWSWRQCETLASLPTSIDCLRHAFDCSSHSLAITYALTVAQDIPSGLLSATVLSFALTAPVDTAVWECR
jgi:hypothetical protein